jgi:hypothetical protein
MPWTLTRTLSFEGMDIYYSLYVLKRDRDL